MTKEFPLPITSNTAGTWAHSTITARLPDIADRVIEENQFPKEVNDNLSRLREDISYQPIRFLLDQGAPDQRDWEAYIQPHIDQSWLDVPWFFAEHYFYRRIMEAVNYFQLGQDPFAYQKNQGLEKSREDILTLTGFLQRRLGEEKLTDKTLEEGLYYSLWGNQADLSMWPAGSTDDPKHASQESLQAHLLANDIDQVIALLCGGDIPLARLDIMMDSAGFELISDLALVDILLSLGLVEQVVLHTKAHPTFVSDVIPENVGEAIRFLTALPAQEAKSFGSRLAENIDSNRLKVQSHQFWNSPLPLWDLPEDLWQEWKTSSLVISKGDMNYRRILGDLKWDFEMPFPQVVDYLPTPLVALRTLKAEITVGMDLDQIHVVKDQDPNWMVNGRWGVIHFSPGAGEYV